MDPSRDASKKKRFLFVALIACVTLVFLVTGIVEISCVVQKKSNPLDFVLRIIGGGNGSTTAAIPFDHDIIWSYLFGQNNFSQQAFE